MVDRPRKFDYALEGKPIGERLIFLGNYLQEVDSTFPTPPEYLDRWKDVKDYLLWLTEEG